MAIEHKDIPDSGLHEPKGAANAAAGTVYVADGSGSGSWIVPEPKGAPAAQSGQTYYANGLGSGAWAYPPEGWAQYEDSGAVPQTITTSPTLLAINGLGPLTQTSFLPKEIRGSGQLWDTTDNLITPIQLGDAYVLRVDLNITGSSGAPKYLLMQLDVGESGVPFIAMEREIQVDRTSAPFEVSVGFPIFSLGNFMANGGKIFLSSDAGTYTLGKRSILISRTFGER